MSRAHYVIFHPDTARQTIGVNATIVEQREISENWKGEIWVDEVFKGNEDPYVFSAQWLYSFCHAPQLRRERSSRFVQKGSWLIFCSCEKANQQILCVDTVFLVNKAHEWTKKPNLMLPSTFDHVKKDRRSDLWRRHFRYPFSGIHDCVSHTYEAKMGKNASFLPLTKDQRTEFNFNEIPSETRMKIAKKVWGKYPVLLDEMETNDLIEQIQNRAEVQVIGNIQMLE